MHSRSTRLLVCRKNDSRNVPDTTVTPLLESSLVSETVFSETVAQTGVSFIAGGGGGGGGGLLCGPFVGMFCYLLRYKDTYSVLFYVPS